MNFNNNCHYCDQQLSDVYEEYPIGYNTTCLSCGCKRCLNCYGPKGHFVDFLPSYTLNSECFNCWLITHKKLYPGFYRAPEGVSSWLIMALPTVKFEVEKKTYFKDTDSRYYAVKHRTGAFSVHSEQSVEIFDNENEFAGFLRSQFPELNEKAFAFILGLELIH